MQPLLAVLEFGDYAMIAAIVMIFAGGAFASRQAARQARLLLQVRELHRKLDALLKHCGVEVPAPAPDALSPEVQQLARDPGGKIAAIKLYRDEHPEAGLAEAKRRIEAFIETGA